MLMCFESGNGPATLLQTLPSSQETWKWGAMSLGCGQRVDRCKAVLMTDHCALKTIQFLVQRNSESNFCWKFVEHLPKIALSFLGSCHASDVDQFRSPCWGKHMPAGQEPRCTWVQLKPWSPEFLVDSLFFYLAPQDPKLQWGRLASFNFHTFHLLGKAWWGAGVCSWILAKAIDWSTLFIFGIRSPFMLVYPIRFLFLLVDILLILVNMSPLPINGQSFE